MNTAPFAGAGEMDFRPPGVWVELRELWTTGIDVENGGGHQIHPRLRCVLHRSEKSGGVLELSVNAPRPLKVLETPAAGGFQAELWRADVAELFLLNAATGCYLELHLNPRAAWWAGFFTAPRVQDLSRDLSGLPVKARAEISETSWTGTLEICWKAVRELLQISIDQPVALQANLAAIRWHPAGRRFYSAVPMSGEAPDFHQPPAWRMIML